MEFVSAIEKCLPLKNESRMIHLVPFTIARLWRAVWVRTKSVFLNKVEEGIYQTSHLSAARRTTCQYQNDKYGRRLHEQQQMKNGI